MPTGLVSMDSFLMDSVCYYPHSIFFAGETPVPPTMASSHAEIWPPSLIPQPQDSWSQQSHSRGIHTVIKLLILYERLSRWWTDCRAAPLATLLVDGASHLLMSEDVPSMETCLAWRVEKVLLRDPETMRKWIRRSGESSSQKKRSLLKR